jgi:hypothetical protein
MYKLEYCHRRGVRDRRACEQQQQEPGHVLAKKGTKAAHQE